MEVVEAAARLMGMQFMAAKSTRPSWSGLTMDAPLVEKRLVPHY